MNREFSPMMMAAVVLGLLVCVGGFFLLRGALAPRPDTARSEKAGQQMMESMRRPRGSAPAAPQGGGGTPMMPGQPGGMPTMPGQPGGMPRMPGQPGN